MRFSTVYELGALIKFKDQVDSLHAFAQPLLPVSGMSSPHPTHHIHMPQPFRSLPKCPLLHKTFSKPSAPDQCESLLFCPYSYSPRGHLFIQRLGHTTWLFQKLIHVLSHLLITWIWIISIFYLAR